jgi:hypothetical protein
MYRITLNSKQIVSLALFISGIVLFLSAGFLNRPLTVPDELMWVLPPPSTFTLWDKLFKAWVDMWSTCSGGGTGARCGSLVCAFLSILSASSLSQHIFKGQSGFWTALVLTTSLGIVCCSQLVTDLWGQTLLFQFLISSLLLYLHHQTRFFAAMFFIIGTAVTCIAPWHVVSTMVVLLSGWTLQLWRFVPKATWVNLASLTAAILLIGCIAQGFPNLDSLYPLLRKAPYTLISTVLLGFFPWSFWLANSFNHPHKVYAFYLKLIAVWGITGLIISADTEYVSSIFGSLSSIVAGSMIIGEYLNQRWNQRYIEKDTTTLLSLLGYLTVGCGLMYYMLFITMNHPHLTTIWPWAIAATVTFGFGALITIAIWYRRQAWRATLVTLMLTTGLTVNLLRPIAADLQPFSSIKIAGHMLSNLQPHDHVFTMGASYPDLGLYLEHPVHIAKLDPCPDCYPEHSANNFWRIWQSSHRVFLVMPEFMLTHLRQKPCFAESLDCVIAHDQDTVLLTNRSQTLDQPKHN